MTVLLSLCLWFDKLCFKICAKKRLGEPSWKHIFQLHVSERKYWYCLYSLLIVFCVELWAFFCFIFLVCFGNCVLTWCECVNVCDLSRGDLTGTADNIKIEELAS